MSEHTGVPAGSRTSCWPRAYRVAGLAAVLGLALVAALHTQGKLIRVGWYPLGIWLVMPGLMAWMWGRTHNPGASSLRRWWPLLVLTGVLLLILFSSATFHRWFFFMYWEPVAKVGAGGLARFVWLAALFTPLYAIGHRRRWAWILPLLVLIGFEVACIQAIFEVTGGRAIYRTDHPSFMFRLWELSRNFPQLVSYLPNWNGGIVHISSVASGTAAPTLVLLPLFRYFPVHEIYTAAWTLLFLVVIPWLGVYSVRVIGGSWTSAFTGGVLSLGLSQHFYLWALHFGTIGATFTAAMTMPVCALGYRIVHLGRIRRSMIVGFVLSGFLLLVWPPGGLVAGGAVLSTLLAARKWTRRKVRVLALAGACILLLYSPWLYAILVQARSVIDFITTPAEVVPAAEAASFTWAAWWSVVQPALMRGVMMLKWQTLEMNPLIIVFGLLGVLAGVDRRLRCWYLPIFLVLALITGWAKEFLPNSQMSRMAIPLAFAAVVPAALFVGRLLRLDDRRLAGVRAIILAALISTGMTVFRICGNHGPAKYVAMGEQVDTLVAWLKANTPADGRILFAGKCVHYYGKGNVAYLSVLAEREMMAVDYYGFPPEQVLYEYPPRPFRKTPELLQTFFNSYNVSHLVTYHEDWKRHFRAEPALYKEIVSLDERTTIFERTTRPGMFLQGAGRVKASPNRLTITLDDPQAPAVVAYNWANGWRAPAPVTIHPHTVVEGLVLIGITPNGQREFTLEYQSKGDVPDA